MSINVTERLLGTWYFPFPGGDYLFALEQLDDCYQVVYRYRQYVDDKYDDTSEDIKHWHKGTMVLDSPEDALAMVRNAVKELREVTEVFFPAEEMGEVTELLMHDGDVDDFVRRLTEAPFAHSRTMTRQ